MRKIIRLTESDLNRIVNRIINEDETGIDLCGPEGLRKMKSEIKAGAPFSISVSPKDRSYVVIQLNNSGACACKREEIINLS